MLKRPTMVQFMGTLALLLIPPTASAQQGVSRAGADTLRLFLEFQVEEPVRRLAWPKPQYPDSLRAAKVDGEVTLEFVVDTSGHIESHTLRVTRSTHPALTRVVMATVSGARFTPARIAGRPVRQLVHQTFFFAPPA